MFRPAAGKYCLAKQLSALITDRDYLKNQPADTIIALDCGDLRYAGLQDLPALGAAAPLIINIDHHQTNTNFGQINLVCPTAVSTTEIIFYLFQVGKDRP